ncbi:pectinesterase PPME1-like [Gossypium australe]|uniref:Pectinesterase PPME1-like n=1 Tax=Gossypium australe TaxID=47621 RepID=A0A5B6UR26_9ROSI|nr:pectinesterase PPME1-like [Gossypium australe]
MTRKVGCRTQKYSWKEIQKEIGNGSNYSTSERKFIGGHGLFVRAGRITGTAKDVFLGRAWKSSPRVVILIEMDEIVHPGGWSSNRQPERAEWFNTQNCVLRRIQMHGKRRNSATREKFVKQLSDAEAEPFLVLDYVEGTKWLLPPPTVPI